MKISLNREWLRYAYPNCPQTLLDELFRGLSLYFPNAEKTFQAPGFGELSTKHWSYPFLIEDHEVDTFDYDGLEEWRLFVEQELAEKYNLSVEVFSW